MIDKHTDFFAYVDNFAKIEGIESIKISGEENPSAQYTIAIPTYKRTEYLKEAIDSARNQDCTFPYNILVVDNNPQRGDDTENMMKEYKDRNISYYKNAENLGMAGNWNRLFQLTKTKWVVMLHDDDVLYPFYLSECSAILETLKDVGVLKTKEDKNNNPLKQDRGIISRLIDFDFYYGNTCGTPSGMLFNREIFLASGGYNQDFYPSLDYCFHVRFASLFNFYFYDKPLMYYRIEVNESLKAETQRQWLINDSFLIRQLLGIYHIPNIIINCFVSRRTARKHLELQKSFNSSFDFNIKEIGLSKVGVIAGICSHAIIKIWMIFVKIWTLFVQR